MKKLSLSLLLAMMLALTSFGCTNAPEQEVEVKEKAPVEKQETKKEEKKDPDDAALAEGKTVKYVDKYFTNFQEAIEDANQNGGGTVVLLADSVVSESDEVPTIAFRTNIIIKSKDGNAYTLTRKAGSTDPLLRATDGTITIQDVVFDGEGIESEFPLIAVSNLARVTFGQNCLITNGLSSVGASALSASGADVHLIFEGLEITNCNGLNAAIANDGATITNDGVTFSGNAPANYEGSGKVEGAELA